MLQIHGAQGPVGWNFQLFGNWTNVCLLQTLVPARMKSEKMRTVIIMYCPMNRQNGNHNPMGFRNPIMARIKVGFNQKEHHWTHKFQAWICGPGRQDSCPIGERLAGCCSHVASAMYMAGVLASNPALYKPRGRACHIVDRGNRGGGDIQTVSEVF